MISNGNISQEFGDAMIKAFDNMDNDRLNAEYLDLHGSKIVEIIDVYPAMGEKVYRYTDGSSLTKGLYQ